MAEVNNSHDDDPHNTSACAQDGYLRNMESSRCLTHPDEAEERKPLRGKHSKYASTVSMPRSSYLPTQSPFFFVDYHTKTPYAVNDPTPPVQRPLVQRAVVPFRV